MALTINVPQEYGYVVLATAGTFWLGFWHGFRVSFFRRPAGVAYPQLMVSPEQIAAEPQPDKKKALHLYNCAQRAHGNYQENQPAAALSLLIAGMMYPRVATGLGLGWMFFRWLYAVGYTNPNKENGSGRLKGLWWFLFQWGLQGTAAWVGIKMIMDSA